MTSFSVDSETGYVYIAGGGVIQPGGAARWWITRISPNGVADPVTTMNPGLTNGIALVDVKGSELYVYGQTAGTTYAGERRTSLEIRDADNPSILLKPSQIIYDVGYSGLMADMYVDDSGVYFAGFKGTILGASQWVVEKRVLGTGVADWKVLDPISSWWDAPNAIEVINGKLYTAGFYSTSSGTLGQADIWRIEERSLSDGSYIDRIDINVASNEIDRAFALTSGNGVIFVGGQQGDVSGDPRSRIETYGVVKVVNNQSPLITLLGSNPLSHTQGDSFTDSGATATDAEDGDLTGNIVVGGDVIDSSTSIGSYAVTYDVTDSGGSPALQIARIVDVVDSSSGINNPPVANDVTMPDVEENQTKNYTLSNSSPNTTGDIYDIDGDLLTVTILTQSTKGDVSVVGSSTLQYTNTDSVGGVDSFTYKIDDGNGGTDTGVVTINIVASSPPPPPPSCGDNVCDKAAGESLISCPSDCFNIKEF